MAAGGEIKNTLTLDVSKFSSALDKAISGADNLEKQLKSAAKVAADFDKGITGVGKDLAGIASNFRLLDQTVSSMVSKLTGIVAGFDQLGKHSATAAGGVERLGSAVKKTTNIDAGQWLKKYAGELNNLTPALKSAVASIVEFDKANAASAKSTSDLANKSAQAKIKALETERLTNNEIIANRRKTVAELQKIQSEFDAKAAAAQAKVEEARRRKKNGSAARAELAEASGQSASVAADIAALQEVIKQIRYKNLGIGESIKLTEAEIVAIEKKAAAEKASAEAAKIARREEQGAAKASKQAAEEAAKAAKQAAEERIRAAKEAAAFERQQANDIMVMWKGMAQLWAASKVGAGFGASLKSGDDRQRMIERYETLNMGGPEGVRRSLAGAEKVSQQNQNLSITESMKLYMAAQAGMARPDHQALDTIVPEIAKVLTVLQRQFPEQAHNIENLGRNFMGVMESMGITHDTKKMTEALDNVYRALLATQGKMNEQDIETIMRRGGAGNATNKGMESILWDVAMASQLKVMGGGAGGGAGGVSTFATSEKMALKRIMGGTRETYAGLQNQLDFGLIDKAELLEANGGKLGRNYRPVAWKGANEAMENPIPYLINVAESIKAQLKEGGAKAQPFIKGLDVNDDRQLSIAFGKWVDKTIGNTNVAEIMKAVAPHDTQNRLKEEVDTSKNAMSYEEAQKKALESWDMTIKKIKARMDDLGATIGVELIKTLTPAAEAFANILDAANDFAKNNPVAAQMTAIAVAVGGAVLGLRGLAAMFGIVGSTSAVMTRVGAGILSVLNPMTTVRAASVGFAASMATMQQANHVAWAKMVTSTTGATGTIGPRMTYLATVTGNAFKLIGGAFMRAIPFVGWLLMAWDFAQLIGNVKVGGSKISDWMTYYAEKALLGWEVAWAKLKSKWIEFKKWIGGDDYLDYEKDKAENDATLARAQAADDRLKGPKKAEEKKEGGKGGSTGTGGHAVTSGSEGGSTGGSGGRPNPITAPTGDTSLPAQGKDKRTRLFEDAFARQFYAADTRANIEGLKLDALMSGEANFGEQAKQEVIKMWMGGDLDDGKDPSKRKAVKGANYNKQGVNTDYDPLKGYSPDQIDWEAQVKIGTDKDGKAITRSLSQLQELIAKRKEEQAVLDGLKFAKERSAAADEEAATAMKRLAGETLGETDAMRALNREFARKEKGNPGIANDKNYQDEKQKALAKQAIADYANMGANLVQKNKEMEAQFLTTERERLEASVQATYEAKEREAKIVMDSLNKQVKALEDAGKQGSDLWKEAIAAREAGEAEFTRYLKNIGEERKRALETPMQKMLRDWQDFYGNLDKLGDKWAEGFTDEITKMLTTGKADFRSFAQSVMVDLAKIAIKNSIAGFLGGPEGVGGAGLGGLLKVGIDKLMGKGGLVGGGLKPPAGGLGAAGAAAETAAVPGMEGALGSGIKAATPGLGAGAGGAIEEQAAKLGESFNGIAESAEAASLAQETMTVATEGSTMATELNTITTEMDTAAIQTSTVATTVDTLATEAETAATTVAATSELADAAANQFDASTEIANAAANQYDAATEYLANGGIADGFGLSMFANGGAFTNGIYSDPTIFKFANGGQFGVMGEAGPEAVMPLSRDSKGRLGVSVNNAQEGGDGAAASPVVNIAITVNKDGGGSSSQSGDDAAQWRQMADRVKGIVIQEIGTQQRPGGLLYK
jgi:lambda family phage tail tape measure protein